MNLHKCLLTRNECYIAGQGMTPKGVMVHSTAANNPRLSRYVGPDDGLLGAASPNNWNQFRPGGRQVCVHAFIGKLADGMIATYQTLPWDMVGWHAGGNANWMGYIGFEICEDGLESKEYFNAVYQEAVELTAYLCKEYSLNPLADGVVICHAEGYKRGIASNHGDVLHWFPKHGKNMDTFRRDVAKIIEEGEPVSYEQWKEYMVRFQKEEAAKQAKMPELLKEAVAMGITDGSRPGAPATREEAAVMARAAAKVAK